MRTLIVVALLSLGAIAHAQEANAPPPPEPKATPCLAVVEAGSHGLRNFMLGGIAGAIMSKMQYKVVAVSNYPAKVGQKFHGSDLQMFSASGTKVVILDKKYSPSDLLAACGEAPKGS